MPTKKQPPKEIVHSEAYVKNFFDMVVPSTIKFNVNHYICGDSYRSVWAIIFIIMDFPLPFEPRSAYISPDKVIFTNACAFPQPRKERNRTRPMAIPDTYAGA